MKLSATVFLLANTETTWVRPSLYGLGLRYNYLMWWACGINRKQHSLV